MIALQCPGCGATARVIGGQAFHECPKRNNRITQFEPVDPAKGEQ